MCKHCSYQQFGYPENTISKIELLVIAVQINRLIFRGILARLYGKKIYENQYNLIF